MSLLNANMICQALAGTFISDNNNRKEAEAYLKSISCYPGLLSILEEIVKHENVDENVRVSASVMLKNQIRNSWGDACNDKKQNIFEENEKEKFRNSIFDTLNVVCQDKKLNSNSVRSQLIECIRLVAFHDYPERWNGLLPKICYSLEILDDETRVTCALLTLRKLVQKYEYKASSQRDSLDHIIDATFPLLIKASSEICKIGFDNHEAAVMLKLICKIYWSSTQLSLSKSSLIVESLDDWMRLMDHIIKARVNLPCDAYDELSNLDFSNSPQFKAKKWALQIIHRFFVRYATRNNIESKKANQKEFAEKFLNFWSLKHTENILNILKENFMGITYLTKRLLNLSLKFIVQGIEIANIYKNLIKPNADFLLFNVCFPLMCYNKKDAALWEEDAVEFVRTQTECMDSFCQPKEAALELVTAICRLRGVDFLHIIFSNVESIFKMYELHKNNNSLNEDLHSKKYGALYMFSCIVDRLSNKKRNIPLESLLENYVINELNSEDKFLRMRACSVLETYIPKIEVFKNSNNLINSYRGMLKCLVDCELPVRLQSAISIKVFFDLNVDVIHQDIIHSIQDLMKQLFLLMKEMDSELIVTTLDSLVSNYEQHISPFSRDLIEALSQTLIEIMHKECQNNEDNDELILAGSSVIQTIKSVLNSISEKPEMYIEIVNSLSRVLDVIFLPDNIDQLEDGLEILTYITYHINCIPRSLWKYFEWMHIAVCGKQNDSNILNEMLADGFAPDYLEFMIPSLDNFMTRDFDTFNRGTTSDGIPYKTLVFSMAKKVLDIEFEARYGLELLCILFESCFEAQSANDYVYPTVELTCTWLNKKKKENEFDLRYSEKKKIIKLFTLLMFYSPEQFFRVTQDLNVAEQIFDFIFCYSKTLKGIDERRFIVLGFTKIIEEVGKKEKEGSAVLLPSAVIGNLQKIVCELCSHFVKLVDLKQKNRTRNSCDAESYVTESVDSEQELNENDDANEDNDLHYIEKLHKSVYGKSANLRDVITIRDNHDLQDVEQDDIRSDEDDEEDFESSFETDLEADDRTSPLDQVKEADFINATFSCLSDSMRMQIQNWLGTAESVKFNEALKLASNMTPVTS